MKSLGETIGLAFFLLAITFLFVHFQCGCAHNERQEARAVVATVAMGVKRADLACADAAIHKKSVELAYKCGGIVDKARNSLISAEEMIDMQDEAAQGRIPCAVKEALESLAAIGKLVLSNGGKIPPAVDDAAKFAELFAGLCHG